MLLLGQSTGKQVCAGNNVPELRMPMSIDDGVSLAARVYEMILVQENVYCAVKIDSVMRKKNWNNRVERVQF